MSTFLYQKFVLLLKEINELLRSLMSQLYKQLHHSKKINSLWFVLCGNTRVTGGNSPEKTFSNLSTVFIFQCIQLSDKSIDKKIVKLWVNTIKTILQFYTIALITFCTKQNKSADCGFADQYNFWCSGRFLRKLQNFSSVGSVTPGTCSGFTASTSQCQNNKELEVLTSVTTSAPPLLTEVIDLGDQTR